MSVSGTRDPVTFDRVEHALRKLEANPDSFGDCESCTQPIPLDRLVLVPYAERCVRCQKDHDPPQPASDRIAVQILRW
jgi:DnaK suppressor protein